MMMTEPADTFGDYQFVKVASQAELPPGERLLIEINGQPIVILNLAGKLFAMGDICTHDNAPLGDGDLDGYQIICPRHGARFDVRTGKALTLPAVHDSPAYPVRVRDGQIEIGIPKS